MKRNLLFTLIALIGITFSAFAQTASISKLADGTAPVIDGTIDAAWDEVDKLEIATVPTGQANKGYAISAGGFWRGLWNADGLYILIEFEDDVYGNDEPFVQTYEDDGFDVAIAWGNLDAGAMKNDGSDEAGFVEINPESNGETTIGSKNYGNVVDSVYQAANSAITSTKNFEFALEAFLPWSVFSEEDAAVGDEFCFDIRYNDDDQTEGNDATWAAGFGRDGQVVWGENPDAGWNVPGDWSRISLVEGNVIATGLFDRVAAQFNVYPNPATGSVNITNIELGSKVSIFNLVGREVVSTVANSNSVQLDITNLNNGVYFVKAGNATQKLIVQ